MQKIFVTMFPCNECAKLLIQAGIVEVIYQEVSVTILFILLALGLPGSNFCRGFPCNSITSINLTQEKQGGENDLKPGPNIGIRSAAAAVYSATAVYSDVHRSKPLQAVHLG